MAPSAALAACLSREPSYLEEGACHLAPSFLEVGAVGGRQTKLLRVGEGVEGVDLPLSCHLEVEEVDAYLLEEVGVVEEVAFLLLLPFLEVVEVEEVAQKRPSGAEH